ncbi:Radical SAM domain protein [Melioribacter roseus P3M-2]|uniref:Radical SAM domain protein n=1 Tax=Melioribacter roseus (strain DSM 23840 / JCM 17771 / VKM B-2668 / P3M-2) TaxID=1191523 RepID=I6Z3Y4_MELRP|nr:radical SAM protein [Melioribacter roseus]AFN73860.1 Radical SAM domain protein [Melioribacter roseus P3M-2]
MAFIPSYIKLLESGELKTRAESAYEKMRKCTVCPKECGVDRTNYEYGFCLSGHLPIVSSYTPHFGEEPVLSGTSGAGNIFFGNCNLRCIYCQNYQISQNWEAEKFNETSYEKLAEIMLELQERGCHNIGLVSPTHFAGSILKSIYIAAQKGLRLPIIYNSNGYDSVETLKLYEGVVDIYLPDFKYGSSEYGKLYSNAKDYFEIACKAIKEMHRQVGSELVFEGNTVARGLIIRHLVLPNDLSETERVFKFISEELDNEVHISLMSQYYPAHKAIKEPLLSRTLRPIEYYKAIELMEKYGLKNGWIQELESYNYYRPDFEYDRKNPFGN